MAYQGGTEQISPRLLNKQLMDLQERFENVNGAINDAMWQFVHAIQMHMTAAEDMEYITGRRISYVQLPCDSRTKKTLRVRRELLDYCRINKLIVGRVLDIAIANYLQGNFKK